MYVHEILKITFWYTQCFTFESASVAFKVLRIPTSIFLIYVEYITCDYYNITIALVFAAENEEILLI